MAFKLAQSDRFYYVVKIPHVRDDGTKTNSDIRLQFKRFTVDELRDRNRDDGAQLFRDLMLKHDGDKEKVNEEFAVEIIRQGKADMTAEDMVDDLIGILTGWRDVTDDAGILEFSRENLTKLVNFAPAAYPAIKAAFNDAHSAEARRGN